MLPIDDMQMKEIARHCEAHGAKFGLNPVEKLFDAYVSVTLHASEVDG
jgi:hypothetical protein